MLPRHQRNLPEHLQKLLLLGGLVPKITYAGNDHGASFTARMVKVKEDGTFIPLTNFYIPGKDKIKFVKH